MAELFKLMGTITIDADAATRTLNQFENVLNQIVTSLNSLDTNTNEANSELKTIRTTVSNVATEMKELDTKISNAATEFGQLATKANTAGDQLRQTNSGIGAAAVFLGNVLEDLMYKAADLSWEFIKMGFQFNSSAESYKAAFKTMLGINNTEATDLYEKMRLFAQETPLSLDMVAQSAVRLFNAGYDAEGVFSTLKVLGDVARGDNVKMQRLVKAWTDIDNYGWMRAQERNQLVEADVAINKMLGQYLGLQGSDEEVIEQLTAMQEQKQLTDQVVWNALLMATSEGGTYHNAMLNAMTTLAGQTEKTGDQLQAASGAFTLPFFDVVKNETLPEIQKTIEDFKTWATSNENSLKEIAVSLSDISLSALDGLINLFTFCVDNKDLLAPAIAGVATALGAMFVAAHPLVAVFAGIAAGLNAIIENEDKLNSWLMNSTIGGAYGVTQKEVELRKQAQKLLGMSADDYASEADYIAARETETNAFKQIWSDLVMRVHASEDKDELAERLGMSVGEYMAALYSDVGKLLTGEVLPEDLKHLNSLTPFYKDWNRQNTQGVFEGAFGTSPYYEDPNGFETWDDVQKNKHRAEDKMKGAYGYFSPQARAFVEDLWDFHRLGINPYETSYNYAETYSAGLQEIMRTLGEAGYAGTMDNANSIIRSLFYNFDNYDTRFENLPDRWFTRDNVNLDGVGGDAGSVANIIAASMQGAIGQMESAVSAGAQAGCAAGISGITVTGHITTGNVMLSTGALAGALTPTLDLRLGKAGTFAGRRG